MRVTEAEAQNTARGQLPVGQEANAAFRYRRPLLQPLDLFHYPQDDRALSFLRSVKPANLAGEFFMACHHLAKFHKSSNDDDVHLRGAIAIEH